MNVLVDALEILNTKITHLDACTTRDNCISAFGKIMFFCSEFLTLDNLFPYWLSLLPLESDMEEVVWPIRLLCWMSSHPKFHCFFTDFCSAQRILEVLDQFEGLDVEVSLDDEFSHSVTELRQNLENTR
eukprot:TRINITY_DN3766_c0_g1_i6.p2 TRINITY_DN3766_c0_g1~~TRINITY_DN3766_c0_g1_i6.p2  ORF type:complete len:129 (-),score=26.73 TRINITY_DN3766_c0_g1_i6:684-1070(-)